MVDQTFSTRPRRTPRGSTTSPSTAAIYLDADGTPRDVGTTMSNPDLAKTYERIGRLGPKGFYRGPIADAIVGPSTHPPTGPAADHDWRPGLLTTATSSATAR